MVCHPLRAAHSPAHTFACPGKSTGQPTYQLGRVSDRRGQSTHVVFVARDQVTDAEQRNKDGVTLKHSTSAAGRKKRALEQTITVD